MLFYLCLGNHDLHAQELNVKLTINHQQVGNTTRTDIFEALQEKLTNSHNEKTRTNMQYDTGGQYV